MYHVSSENVTNSLNHTWPVCRNVPNSLIEVRGFGEYGSHLILLVNARLRVPKAKYIWFGLGANRIPSKQAR